MTVAGRRATRAGWIAGLALTMSTGCSGFAPRPKLLSLDTAVIVEGQATHVVVRGVHLQPPLDVAVGDSEPEPLLIEQPTRAEFTVRDVAPGHYDVVLYQGGERLGLLPRALTVEAARPAPTAPVGTWSIQLVGVFKNVRNEIAARLATGLRLDRRPQPLLRLLHLGSSSRARKPVGQFQVDLHGVDVPAAVRLRLGPSCAATPLVAIQRIRTFLCADSTGTRLPHCSATECAPAEVLVAGGIVLPVHTELGRVDFKIAEVRSADTLPQKPLRMSVSTRVVAMMDPADETPELSVGSRLFTLQGTPLGVVIARRQLSDQANRVAIRLAVAMTCTPVAGGCTYGNDVIEPGVRLPVQLPHGPAILRVEELQPPDVPIALLDETGR